MKKQPSAKLGYVGTYKVQGRDGQAVEFKAKTIGRLRPDRDEPAADKPQSSTPAPKPPTA